MYPQIPNPPIRISMPNLKSKPVALKTILVAQTKKKKKKKKKKKRKFFYPKRPVAETANGSALRNPRAWGIPLPH
jgi:hypothetical protein